MSAYTQILRSMVGYLKLLPRQLTETVNTTIGDEEYCNGDTITLDPVARLLPPPVWTISMACESSQACLQR